MTRHRKLVRTPEEFEGWIQNRGISKESLASFLGVTRQTLHNWTRGAAKKEIERTGGMMIAGSDQFAQIPTMLTLCLFAIDNLPNDVALQELGQTLNSNSQTREQ